MIKYFGLFLILIAVSASSQTVPNLKFTISIQKNLTDEPTSKGRLILFFSRKQQPAPLFQGSFSSDRIGFAINVDQWPKGKDYTFDLQKAFYTGSGKIINWNEGNWFVQAVYNISGKPEFSAPGNLYSKPLQLTVSGNDEFKLELSETANERRNAKPENSELVKYIEMESKLLSDFWNKPMKIRASVLLPRNYNMNGEKKYPVCLNIGGYGSSWTRASRLEQDSTFITWWLSDEAPEILQIFPDGSEGPFGDPYYIDSDNNGPYGKALTEELIPAIEKKYRGMDDPKFRFVEGCSTGGWVSLALQIFYPDYFNGAWSFSPDPVDFHHLQLINMYDGENAFYNQFGYLMPSMRSTTGQPRLSIKDEVAGENLRSFDNSYITSGEQWGSWNALYSPKGADGKPLAGFDPFTGEINKVAVEHWKKYDLVSVLETNWAELGPKLSGKLWIWMGDMDNFYLNNAMREMDAFLKSTTNPVSDAVVNFEATKGHCEGYDHCKVLEMIQKKIQKIK